MDRTDLERRFRERLHSCRREYLRFAAAATFVSIVLLGAPGITIYLILGGLGVQARTNLLVSSLAAGLFLAAGLLVYRKRRPREGLSDRLARMSSEALTFKVGRRRASDWMAWGPDLVGVSYILVPFILASALPLFFLRGVWTGRRAFASEKVVDRAFAILTARGEKGRPVSVETMRDGADLAAIRILAEMELFIFQENGDDLLVLRTTEGEAFLEG